MLHQLAGVDGQIRLSESDAVRFQALATHTREVDNLALVPDSAFNAMTFSEDLYTAGLDGESFLGHAFFAGIGRNTSTYSITADYSELSPTFRADNGFEPQNDQRMGSLNAVYIMRFEKSPTFEYVSLSANAVRKWNFDGVRKDEWITPNLEVQSRIASTGMHFNYLASNELFRGIQFNGIWGAHACFSTTPMDALRLSGNVNYGHRIARFDLVMGKQLDYGLTATLKPIAAGLQGNAAAQRCCSSETPPPGCPSIPTGWRMEQKVPCLAAQ